ncbi:MAG: 3D domain-containing protein [Clostridia bacterium]|nr:3D domain-containing protein [Clostridia bacterium]
MKKMFLTAFLLVVLFTTYADANEVKLKATGYFPSGYKNKTQARIEGGSKDRYGKRLRTLQDYKEGSYVSVATDPRYIKSGTVLKIKEFPNVRFVACDVGRAIKGARIDICVKSEKHSYLLPKKITAEKEYVINDIQKFRNSRYDYMFGVRFAEVWRSAYFYIIQELSRRNSMATDITRQNMVRADEISYDTAISNGGVRCGQARFSRFCNTRYYSN